MKNNDNTSVSVCSLEREGDWEGGEERGAETKEGKKRKRKKKKEKRETEKEKGIIHI